MKFYKDFTQVDFAVLGFLYEKPSSCIKLRERIEHMMGRFWNPVTDVINSRLNDLKTKGLVFLDSYRGTEEYSITKSGVNTLFEIIRSPVECPSDYNTRSILPLKILFLHQLELLEQRQQLNIWIESWEKDKKRLNKVLTDHHLTGYNGYYLRWLEHDIMILLSEIEWFKSLTRDIMNPKF